MLYLKNVEARKDILDRIYNRPEENERTSFVYWKTDAKMILKLCCRSCSKIRGETDFLNVPMREISQKSKLRTSNKILYCNYCLPKIIEDFKAMYDGNTYKALYKLCCMVGWYYDDVLAHRLIEGREKICWDGTEEEIPSYIPWVYVYGRIIDERETRGKSFSFSDNFRFDDVVAYQRSSEGQLDKMTEKEKKDRAQVMSIYHRDPFEAEMIEDKPRLYADLLTMSPEGISEDLPKARAAIEIVRGYLRVDKITDALIQLRTSVEAMIENEKEIKALTEQKRAELSAISILAKENGFSEIANKMKSKGVGTLTGIVREMNENGFDRGSVNKFDIDTVEAMRTIANISAESMNKQLAWTSADYADMVKEQADKIREMQQVMQAQAEELRVLKEQHLRQELVERYENILIEKEINSEEIEKLVKEELKYVPVIEYRDKEDKNKEDETKEETKQEGEE